MSPKGVLVKHPQGFALVIPWHIARLREDARPLVLGRIKVLGNVNKSLRLAGRVPETWLVDLNSAPVEVVTTAYVYLCGPMTGLPDYNYPAFHAAAAELRAQGWVVVNPAENPEPTANPTWDDWMAVSLAQVRGASLLALLPGWESSRGALAEVALAGELGIPCYPLLDVVAGESDRG